jgi:PadR family transcriptional regulator PadR
MLTVRTVEHEGRLRKYYHITKAGAERIESFKSEWREVMLIYQFVTKGDRDNEQA